MAFSREKATWVNIGVQGEGIVAALVDQGRHREALEALGACDTLTGEGARPRDLNSFWGGVLAGRLAAAREALGAQEADAAYAQGRALSVNAVVKLLLSYGAPSQRPALALRDVVLSHLPRSPRSAPP